MAYEYYCVKMKKQRKNNGTIEDKQNRNLMKIHHLPLERKKYDMLRYAENLDTIDPPILRVRLRELIALWKDFRKTRNNTEKMIAMITEILPVVKKKEEWYIYFDLLYSLFYLLYYTKENIKMIKYAEVLYQDMKINLDKAIKQYPNAELDQLCIYDFSYIFEIYSRMHQINDEKCQQFLDFYHMATDKYGSVCDYWEDRLNLALIHADPVMARMAMEKCRQYPVNHGCYICHQGCQIGYYVLDDRPEESVEIIRKLVARDVPKHALHNYETCTNGNSASLYQCLMEYTLELRRPDLFKQYLPDFLAASNGNHGRDEQKPLNAFLRAAVNDFTMLERDLGLAKENIENEHKAATYTNICRFLTWYNYFLKLKENGIDFVAIDIEKEEFPKMNEEGKVDVGLAAEYVEARADDLGKKFAQSRARFDYTPLKETYGICRLVMSV